MKNLKKNDTNYQVEEDKAKNQDIRLISKDMQLDFGAADDDDKSPVEVGVVADEDKMVLKEETMVPKINDGADKIFSKKKATDPGMIGRASMKGFMKEDLDGDMIKSKDKKEEESKQGPKKVEESKA